MVAARLAPDCHRLVPGTPAYFAARRWEFARGGREFFADPRDGTTVNDTATRIALAKRGRV